MATVVMEKAGFDDITVDTSLVSNHEQLGWSRKKIKISADGQTLTVPSGTILNIDDGALDINDVQVLSSASELNDLNKNADLVTTVKYSLIPLAVSAVGVMAAQNLGASTAIKTGSDLTKPDYPRTVTAKGNVSGISGNVVIDGTNINGEVIQDTIALSGTSEIEGIKAFKTVTQVTLPAQTHTPTAQVETGTVAAAGTKQVEKATVVGSITPVTGGGNAKVIVTAAGMTGNPKTIEVAVAASDAASDVAGKIRTALGLDAAVTALFDVGGTGADVQLTSKTFAANDDTLNIDIDNDTCTGLTTEHTSANTTAGVAVNTVGTSGNAKVIITAAGMTGTPKTISVAVLVGDLVGDVATKIRAALTADSAVAALFTVGGTGANVSLTKKTPAADDGTLNIDIDNDTCAGLTAAHSSTNTTGGVPYDTVSVGIAKKIGLEHVVANAALLQDALFNGSTDAGSLAVNADHVDMNLYSLAGTPDGEKELDLYYLA